jgi:hypothetical protein
MPTAEPRDWPFPVLPPEQRTEEHQAQIRFLDTALQAGFQPCWFPGEQYQVHASGRYGWLIRRGRTRKDGPTRWEVWLDEATGRAAAYWVDDFDTAAASVLEWLRGGEALAITEAAKPHIISGPSFNAPRLAPSPG